MTATLHNISQVAVPDLIKCAKDADVLIFVLPHQFIKKTCETLKGQVKPGAVGISLIKVRPKLIILKNFKFCNIVL